MQAVILAAGLGKRMRPYTETMPKPLIPIEGKPIIFYTFAALPYEIDEVVMIIGYRGEQIREYLGNNFWDRKIYYIEQKEMLGTGAAFFLAQRYVKGKFLIMMGDDLYWREDVSKCLSHSPAILGAKLEIGLGEHKKFGILEIKSDGMLRKITEKPTEDLPPEKSILINTGLYSVDERIFDFPSRPSVRNEVELTDSINLYASKYKVNVIRAARWQPVSTPEDLERARQIIGQFHGHRH